MEQTLKRISLMIGDQQYQELNKRNLNISGLVRDLVDDYLSEHKITINVSEETRALYDKIVANTGSTDRDVEQYFRTSLKTMLKDKIKEMQSLEELAFGSSE